MSFHLVDNVGAIHCLTYICLEFEENNRCCEVIVRG